MNPETKNAKIRSTMLGYQDHGILTFQLYLEYGNSGCQGAGGYVLDTQLKEKGIFKCRQGTAAGMELIGQILKVVGVDKWEQLPGTHIRAKATHDEVFEIGHLLEDRWLNFSSFFENFKAVI